MGYREVVVKAAGTDGSGNPTPAVLDYYDEFTTLEGIVTVSYTHLDVYKRQPYHLLRIPAELHHLPERP